MADDIFGYDEDFDYFAHLWKPERHDGWTWVQKMTASPETYSLFDADGELMGDVYQRWDRVICWAPFTWAEEAYRSHEDVGAYGFDDEGSASAISRRSARRSATGCGASRKTASTSPCCGTRTRTTTRPVMVTTR